MKTSLHEVQPYVTKDGSLIRELMHPQHCDCKNLSFAQATIEPGHATIMHVHKISEEMYHVVKGKGVMTRGKQVFQINSGDTVCIQPNMPHKVENNGHETLIIFCCCSPPYSHGDTEIHAEMV